MNLRLVLPLAVVLAVIAVALAVAQPWTDTQTSSGNITAASGDPELLYICEPIGAGSEPCPGDDSVADEIVFELPNEALTPGGVAAVGDIRLRNISTGMWDVTGVTVNFFESLDDLGNGDCIDVPTAELTRLNDYFDDPYDPLNHDTGSLPKLRTETAYSHSYGGGFHTDLVWGTVRVTAGQHEDVRIRISLPVAVAAECQGNSWDIQVMWTVEPV